MIITDTIEDIEKELSKVDSNTLVAFDCDEVLTTLSENIWRNENQKFILEWCHKNIPEFSDQTLYDIITFVLMSSENFLVNDKMPEIVKNLNLKASKAVVLTALSTKPIASVADPMAWRLETLKSFGYDFEQYWENVPSKIFEEFSCEYLPAYRSGVICCGEISKSRCLAAFLNHSNLLPKKIVFIDDLEENIDDVGDFCRSRNIDFVGIRYEEARKSTLAIPFSQDILAYQLSTFQTKKIWISETEVKKLDFSSLNTVQQACQNPK